jgi:hypothetical protein
MVMHSPSDAFAEMRVNQRHGEKAETGGEKNDIQHGRAPEFGPE